MPSMSDDELRALAREVVRDMPKLSEEQCRRVALIIRSSGAFRND